MNRKTLTALAILALTGAGCATTPAPVPQAQPQSNTCRFTLEAADVAVSRTLDLLPACERDPNHASPACLRLTAAVRSNNRTQIYQKAAACLKAGQFGDLTPQTAAARRDETNETVLRIRALAERLY